MRTRAPRAFRRAAIAACCAAALVIAQPSRASTPEPTKPKTTFETTYASASPLSKTIGRAADAALDVATGGDFAAAKSQADAAFSLACAYGSDRELDAFREAAFARRLIYQVALAPESDRAELLAFLRSHAALAHTFVFALTDADKVRDVYALLDKLRRERLEQVEKYPELSTALCVVRSHGRHGFNEPHVRIAAPLDVFDFYAAHESQLFYGLRGVPVELLVYVVDNPGTLDDMNWALTKYAGTRNVGALFFKVEYDYDFFEGKADQKLSKAPGYTLANILKVGGICADQAYFATTVAKSIGIPAAWTEGDSATSGHAWVGYLKSNGKSAEWNFNSGRYAEYQDIRGSVADPQSGKSLADSTVSLLGDLIGSNVTARQDAVALVDAARAWGDAKAEPPAYPAALLAAVPGRSALKSPAARPASAEGQLDLVEIGLRQFAAYPRGWGVVADLARAGKLSDPQKRKWSDVTQRMCGQKHMDFALSVLQPMVETVADASAQSDLWDAVFKFVEARTDLAAEVRLRQARMWEKAKNLPRAGQCYEGVLQHYINAGPFALPALKGAESVLKQLGHEPRVLELYAEAAKLVTKPDMQSGRAEYVKESNWYQVREAYAAKLDAAGQKALADQVRAEDNGAKR